MILYHITKRKYLSSIFTNGLLINSNKIGFCKKDAHKRYKQYYGMQPIFLTTDISFICQNMLTKKWIIKNDAVVLKINVELDETNSSCGWYHNLELNETNSSVRNGWYNNVPLEPAEFRYYNNIEAKNIELIQYNLLNDVR